jgi:hypothetical protein
MHLDLNWRDHSRIEDRRGLRSAAGFLVVALGVGAVALVLEFNRDARIFSDPGLHDLLRAQSYLNRSYGPERHLLSESQTARRDLDAAISFLAAAEQADPVASQKLDALRSNLKALETGTVKERMTAADLDARYRNLRAQIEGLIDARREYRQ